MATLDDNQAGVYPAPPAGYMIPTWPGLYLPWADPKEKYLFYPSSIWRYTVYWSLLLAGVTFALCSIYAFIIFSRKGPRYSVYAIWLPVIYCFLGMFGAFIGATVTGFALAAVYSAAYMRMSTWVPFLWASAHILVVVISSYSTLARTI